MSRMQRWWLAGGLFVLVQAAVLAMVHTPAPHPGGDNAGYLALGHALASGQGYVELWAPGAPPHTKYPPAFPALLAAMMLGGAATWGAFKVAIAGLVSLAGVLAFVWAGARRGPLAGAAVGGLAILSSGWIEASRWILSEPLFLALAMATFWAADRGLEGDGDRGWTAVACAGALLAFLTRSAGLPLVLALGIGLVLTRRWKAAGGFAAASMLLGGAWFLRPRGSAEGAYQSEFWMVNPYEPALGTIGPLDLVARAGDNLATYVGTVLPGEWWGVDGPLLAVLGLALAGLALGGWGSRVWAAWRKPDARTDVGVAELFLPLYAGLILIWPQVWAGDRFVLVLYPLLLLWAGEALVALSRRFIEADRAATILAVPAVAALLLGAPAVPGLLDKAEQAADCREIAGADPFRCLGAPMMEFREAAWWAGRNLPDDAVVLTRKPRIFYTLGGTPGRTFPFRDDPEAFLAEAERLGGDYLVADGLDGISFRYLPPLLQSAPGAFCWVLGWGEITDLMRILPADARGAELLRCPDELRPGDPTDRPGPDREPARIPIL